MGTQERVDCPRIELRNSIRHLLGAIYKAKTPTVRHGREWSRDGIHGRELFWNSTASWLLEPSDRPLGPLPAVLLMHGHDGVKFYGKEKVADGPDGIAPGIDALRARGYDGLSPAAELVRAGFAVLVHDVFPWGSRRVPWDEFPDRMRTARRGDAQQQYEAAAREHEHVLAKVAALNGTSLAGMVVREDLVALNVLRSLPGVDPDRVAAAGFSGGGARVTHLLACTDRLRAAVITAMTSTFADIADGRADGTTWLMITPGLPALCDWPQVVSSAAPLPLLVQFCELDAHFGLPGMHDAEDVLRREYAGADTLSTQWFTEPHVFSAAMQHAAIEWLLKNV